MRKVIAFIFIGIVLSSLLVLTACSSSNSKSVSQNNDYSDSADKNVEEESPEEISSSQPPALPEE